MQGRSSWTGPLSYLEVTVADYSRKEKVTRRVIYYLRSPAPYAEVSKAVVAAQRECEKLTGKGMDSNWDDVPMVESHDDEIHIWFEVEVKEGA